MMKEELFPSLEEQGALAATSLPAGFPPEPSSLEKTGLPSSLVFQLLVKTLYVAGELTEASAGQRLKMPYALVNQLFRVLCKDKFCEVRGPGDASGLLYRYALTDFGMMRARDYMDISQYVGPAPVPLAQFDAMIDRQSVLKLHVSRPILERMLSHLVLPREVCAQLGGAVNSGWPIFLYGESGNGKTVIAEGIGNMLMGAGGGEILVPYAIEIDNQIIEVYDPATHAAVDVFDGEGSSPAEVRSKLRYDTRWVLCKRPTVFVGGELTLQMLDLTFNPISKHYTAPLQVKANGGVFIIDDFGRQHVQPQALLNRWIVPLEKRVDYLALHTGKKFRVPFDTVVVFCTNIEPRQLADEAFLRRMRNKIYVGDPTREAFTEIFRRYCGKRDLVFERGAIEYLYQHYYVKDRFSPRNCHPRDLIEQIVSIAKCQEIPPSLDLALLDRACRTYFLLKGPENDTAPEPDSRQG